MHSSVLERAADWAGWPLNTHTRNVLMRYARWLVDEAIPAGGLGPNEGPRVVSRHVADSLLFAGGWPGPHSPASVVDLGSGVGLPGIPLGVLWPNSHVLLVDRAGRRVDLARRAVRVLELENVEVAGIDASRVASEADLVVARAAARLEQVSDWARRLLRPGGRLVVGGSWEERPEEHPDFEVVEVASSVLDRGVWLRIMAAA